MPKFGNLENQVLDKIISTRRSTRSFNKNVPEKTFIEAVIEAGRQAPYAGLAQKGRTDFRHFFVIPTEGVTSEKIRSAALLTIKEKLAVYRTSEIPEMNTMIAIMSMIAEKGLPPWNAPYLIIIAEQCGYPSREEAAIAFCMQSMWLKATALGLGFQLVSAISDFSRGQTLNSILGLSGEMYAFDACMIGYPEEPLTERLRNEPVSSITWLDS